jgi:hypothetical protein
VLDRDRSISLAMYDDELDIVGNAVPELHLELGYNASKISPSTSTMQVVDCDALDQWLQQNIKEEPWSALRCTASGSGADRQGKAKL